MSRFRVFVISGLVALAGLAAAAPGASAQASEEHASCLGVLSSVSGSQLHGVPGLQRQDFAPFPGVKSCEVV